jgi:phosphatidate phosphatase PAH1
MTKELIITDSLTNKICQEIMLGTPLARLARSKDMPSLTRIYKEIQKNKSFSNKINEARRVGAQTYIENAMSELETADNRNIMVIREKVQLAKWLASKLIPIYGDKQEIKQDTNITIQWTTPNNKEINVTPGAEEIGITQHK